MLKSSDKQLVYNIVKIFGAKLTREKLLERITFLSTSESHRYASAFESITKYGEMLTYLFDNYSKELKEDQQ
jgi:hypothetical protein